jgi:hypothetical protein
MPVWAVFRRARTRVANPTMQLRIFFIRFV